MKNVNGAQTLESMSQAVWYNRWTLNKFKKYLTGEILEVGCGIGNFTGSLTGYHQVWAIDIDPNYIRKTKAHGGIKVGLGNIETAKYFFGNRQFDSVVCLNVLEHIDKDKLALKNLYRLLRKGGVLVLLVPAHPFLYGEIDKSIGHFRRYDKPQIGNKLKEAGFSTIFSRRLNFLGGIGWWIAGKILGENKVSGGKVGVFNILAPIILPLEDLIEPPLGTSILTVARK